MDWTPTNTWIVVAGALGAASCALLGNFLVLRRLSMMGDAISHAVLPGLAVAFLISGSRESVAMFIGAAVVGVLTAVLTQWIHSLGRLDPGASMGVVFTVLFALGLILIVRGANHVDLDPGCVLYGAIELVPLYTDVWLGLEVPRAVITLAAVLVVDLVVVLLFYKELKVSAFDPQLATTLGINAQAMHYVLMVLVAATTVAAFESVGSILVIAMLIVPGAAAHLLTDRLGVMIGLSLLIAVGCAVLGHLGAVTVPGWFGFQDTGTAGMMAVSAGLIFTVVVLGAPRHGVLSKLVHRVSLSMRIVQEDVLGLLYRLEELGDRARVAARRTIIGQALAVGQTVSGFALWRLQRGGRVKRQGGEYRLTDLGRHDARRLVRAHRLWETYLVKYLNLPADHVHTPATQLEHITDQAMQQQLALITSDPQHDPQGKQIPPAADESESR